MVLLLQRQSQMHDQRLFQEEELKRTCGHHSHLPKVAKEEKNVSGRCVRVKATFCLLTPL